MPPRKTKTAIKWNPLSAKELKLSLHCHRCGKPSAAESCSDDRQKPTVVTYWCAMCAKSAKDEPRIEG
jgi:hypothetical protein